MEKLTVLSFGGGQDSTALLYEYVYNYNFRKVYDIKKLLVLISETGNEHDETYAHIEHIKDFCIKYKIEFVQISYNMGFHQGSWADGLVEFYKKTTTCGSKAFPKTCTDNLKVKPIYRFLNWYVMEKYDLREKCFQSFGKKTIEKWKTSAYNDDYANSRLISQLSQKKALKLYAEKYGKIDMMIGIAYGEETRIGGNDTSPVWMQLSINKVYPLIDMKLDRKGCQDLIVSYDQVIPPPSNCIICPFLSYQELLFMWRFNRKWFYIWVDLEAKKLDKYKHLGEKNLGVFGSKTLTQSLEVAQQKYGHWTDEELKEYKMSHGHCVKSKY